MAVAVPIVFQSNPEAFRQYFSGNEPEINVARLEDPSAFHRSAPSLSTVSEIPMDSRGHFIADFKFNGRRVESLVDTGATYIAINESTARKVGIRISREDFKYSVSTANGKTAAASVVISEVAIDNIKIRNVAALVLKDDALKGTLIGMSFLKELSKFTIQDRSLVMRQ